jgi:hypothetical protein
MNFIREYLYETILIAIVVILAPVLYWLASGQAEEAEVKRLDVERVHRQVENLRGRSEAELTARKQSVENIKKAARKLEALSVDYNRRNYDVLQVVSGVGQAETVAPMFPWPVEEMYRERDAYRTVRQAIEQIQSDPAFTRAPYVEDLQEDYAKRYEKLKRLQQRKLQKLEGERGDGRRGYDEDFGPIPDYDEIPGGYPGGPGRIAPPPGADGTDEQAREGILTDQQLQQKAWEEAMFRFALASAREGTLYVDQLAFARTRPDRESGRDRDERYGRYDDRLLGVDEWEQLSRNQQIVRLWEDQVRLWIIEDVLAAIQATNKQGLEERRRQAGAKLPANVLTSPIKRLVWVGSTGEFYTGLIENEAAWDMGRDPERRPDRDFGDQTLTTVTPEANTITGDVSNKEYDVVHYRFTVVMEPRFAGQLQRNLVQRNYHSLLGFTARKASNNLTLEERGRRDYDSYRPGATTGEPDQPKQRSDVHYYGAKPVMEITFHGQLRLLTEWVRGKPAGEQVAGGAFGDTDETPDPRALFDPDPLVPWQVLARPEIQYALREADKQRVKIRKEMAGIATTPTDQ